MVNTALFILDNIEGFPEVFDEFLAENTRRKLLEGSKSSYLILEESKYLKLIPRGIKNYDFFLIMELFSLFKQHNIF